MTTQSHTIDVVADGVRLSNASSFIDIGSASSHVDSAEYASSPRPSAPRPRQWTEEPSANNGAEAELKAPIGKYVPELRSNSPTMEPVLKTIHQIADTDIEILLLGESGTGKGLAARTIHALSSRSRHNFVTINCPSLTAELLESELFGYCKGAFTGAFGNKLGRIDQAQGGTLFLDEVGDFPLSLQPKLLRFLHDREYERVGDPVTRRADVRIVAATNRNLHTMVKDGTFREDLFYRLNVISIDMPPLRERIEDVLSFADSLLAHYVARYRRPARGFTASAESALRSYGWPGNLRELQNTIERAAVVCANPLIDLADLVIPETAPSIQQPTIGSQLSLAALEKAHIQCLLASSPSFEAAAATLGIDVSTLYRKRRGYCIS